MAIRNSWEESGSLYNGAKNQAAAEYNLAVVMFIVGLDWANIDSTTIDNIIDGINNVQKTDSSASITLSSSQHHIHAERRLLCISARRMWRQRHIAIGVQGG